MPFGLTGASATLEQIMQSIFQGCQSFVARLLDDILVFSKTAEDHHQHVGIVLDRLYRYGYTLQIRKCAWFQPSVTFLGFVISQNGICPDQGKVMPILNPPTPTDITELRSFLNATGYLR